MLKKNKKLIILISSLIIFAIILTAGLLITTKKISVSLKDGLKISVQQEKNQSTCLTNSNISKNKNECLFVGCNGFF